MNGFYVWNGRKIKQALVISVALLFGAGIIYVEKENLTVFAEKQPLAVYSVKTDQKVVALTFDISWGDKLPEPIMNTLKDKGVKNATFFLSSPWAKSHQKVVDKLVKNGYEIGSHGHKHLNYSTLTDDEIRNQIQTAHAILTDSIKKQPELLRLPNGDFDKRVLKIADDLGYTVIQWDTDSQDWMDKSASAIVDRVVSRVHPGDIVLLHASDSAKHNLEALPAIIDQLRAKGYDFVTVSGLIHQADLQEEPVRDQVVKPLPAASPSPTSTP
ncbi:polysaccharide deacetylase family sporulation protein PdaB [Gorillibacterium timonense]|uniref:polysaccharide deacetylase family sporulation protein PdaB n=1 Tax=Gorillibacterium timonense TaxID=1689269 RepID=UPI00071E1CCB|nr:polysaccharide deacetylase family sporulation protein PdaB [Gorillibacterium timonense]